MMIWQDIVLAIGLYSLGFALFPSIFGKHKPARWSCLLSAVILIVFTFTFATLELWQTVYAEAFSALCWIILLFQRREA